MAKRFFGFVLALSMLLSLFPSFGIDVSAQDERVATRDDWIVGANQHKGITYAVEGGSLYFNKETGAIVGCDETVTAAVIPTQIDGTAVTSIGYGAFYTCYLLESVTIPVGVTSIDSLAFSDCMALQTLEIPEGVTSIGSNAFQYCTALASVTLPASLKTLGSSVFCDCYMLSEITFASAILIISLMTPASFLTPICTH